MSSLTNDLKSYIGQKQGPAAGYGMTTDCNIFLRLSHTGGRQKDWCDSNEKALARIGKAVRRIKRPRGNTTKLVVSVALTGTLVACILLCLCGSHKPRPNHMPTSVTRSRQNGIYRDPEKEYLTGGIDTQY